MTDLDPLHQPPDEDASLVDRTARHPTAGRPQPGIHRMEGPTGAALTTESAGDPGRDSLVSGGQAGDATNAPAALSERASAGTAPVDPATDPATADPGHGMAGQRRSRRSDRG
jgi:hypothetical protein